MMISRHHGRSAVFLIAFILIPAVAASADEPPGEEGTFSAETIREVDAAVARSAELLSRRQREDGSWGGDFGATALAVQALAAVEPPTGPSAAAVGRGLRFLFEPANVAGAKDSYALAYALAAAHRRPMTNDASGLLGHGERLRRLFKDARASNCGGFRGAVLQSALVAAWTPEEELAAAPVRGRPASACAAFIPEPRNALVRGLYREIAGDKRARSRGPRVRRMFDAVIAQEEGLSLNPSGPPGSGPLGLEGFFWTAVSLTRMREEMLEPRRGCFFSADLLASRLLALRGKDGQWGSSPFGGGDFQTASALLALIHLRYVVVEVVPLPG